MNEAKLVCSLYILSPGLQIPEPISETTSVETPRCHGFRTYPNEHFAFMEVPRPIGDFHWLTVTIGSSDPADQCTPWRNQKQHVDCPTFLFVPLSLKRRTITPGSAVSASVLQRQPALQTSTPQLVDSSASVPCPCVTLCT